jgi:hypothetical protein
VSPHMDADGKRSVTGFIRHIPSGTVVVALLGLLALVRWYRSDWLSGALGRQALSLVLILALVGAIISFGGARFIPIWGRAALILLAGYGALVEVVSLFRATSADAPLWLRGEVIAVLSWPWRFWCR